MKTPSESERVSSYLRNAGAEVPGKYASGGRVKPNTTIQINIEREKPAMDPMAMAAMAKPPVVNPQPAPPPMDPAMMGGQGMPPGAPMPGMNRGGRANYASGGAVRAAKMAAKQAKTPTAAGPKVASRTSPKMAASRTNPSMPGASPSSGGIGAALAGRGLSVPMPMKRGGESSRAHRAEGGRVTKIPMEAGAMSGDGRQNKAISQAKASGQKQPVKGTFRTAK